MHDSRDRYIHALRRKKPGRPAVVMGDLTLVRSLGLAKIPSIVVTTSPDDITVRSRHAVGYALIDGFDTGSGERTAEALVALGRRLAPRGGRSALFYGNDAQLAFLHAWRAPLEESFAFVLNDDALGAALRDKELFYPLAMRAGVPVPRTALADDTGAILAMRAPLVIKPRAKVGWKALQRALFHDAKAKMYATPEELLRDPLFAVHRHTLLVQELVLGDVEDHYSFHGFADPDGRLLAHYSGHKLRTYPNVSGESSFIELTTDPRVIELGMDVVRRLGVRGVFKIDMIRDRRDGQLYVLELNARFNLWNYLGAVHGVNLPAVAYDFLEARDRGEAPRRWRAPLSPSRPRVRWLNFYRDLRAYREGAGRGKLSLRQWARSLASSRKIYEAFAWTDPIPFAWWVAEYVRRRVA